MPIALFSVMLSPTALAWGAKGHLIVGQVAEAQICVSTREALSFDLDDESIVEAGLWPDKIRGYDRWAYTKPWHYINVPDGVDIEKAKRSGKGDVLSAIAAQREELEYDSNLMKARREALRFLIHFVADVHQPLHVGRQEDLGGNRIKVRSEQSLGSSNLHRYWDTDVLAEVSDPRAYAAELLARVEPELVGWQPLQPLDWARESADFRAAVYAYPEPPPGEKVYLDQAYYAKARQIADQRLVLAGLRLAAELDSLYCGSEERRARKQGR
ncbi:MAG: S1/P1 nuclease [Gammaproteobacteria bacterium]